MLKINRRNLKKALLNHYSAPLHEVFKQFRAGAIFFAVGLIIIFLAGNNLESSLQQEIVILGGLVLTGGGFVVAMLAQIRMIIIRVIQFIQKP